MFLVTAHLRNHVDIEVLQQRLLSDAACAIRLSMSGIEHQRNGRWSAAEVGRDSSCSCRNRRGVAKVAGDVMRAISSCRAATQRHNLGACAQKFLADGKSNA